jgi:cytosine permease
MSVSHPPADTDRVGGIELESEFEQTAVPASHRKPLREVAAVWFGFPMILTNAVPGGVVVALLGFWRGVAAITVANLVMLVYVGLLSHRAGSTGRSFALQATQTFGRLGYIVASGFLATIVVGWFAFNTGATGATINASFGWDRTLVILGAGALFIAITFVGIRALSILGAIAAPLFIVVAVIALVTVAGDHDLGAVFAYDGVGGAAAGSLSFGAAVSLIMATFADSGTMTADFTRWSRNGREGVLAAFTAFPVASMVAQLTGGVVVALAGVWSHFLSWLVILSVFVPPIGAVLIADQVLLRGAAEARVVGAVRPTAFAAWAIGAGFAALVHYGAPQWSDAVVGLVTAVVAYLAIEAVAAPSREAVRGVPEPVGAE